MSPQFVAYAECTAHPVTMPVASAYNALPRSSLGIAPAESEAGKPRLVALTEITLQQTAGQVHYTVLHGRVSGSTLQRKGAKRKPLIVSGLTARERTRAARAIVTETGYHRRDR